MLGLVLIAKPRRLEPWQSFCNGSCLGTGKQQASETTGLGDMCPLDQQVFDHYHPCSLLCWSDLQIWHSRLKCSPVRTCCLTPVIQMNKCGRRKRHLTLPEIKSPQAPPLQESLCLLKHRCSFLFFCHMCHGPYTPESLLCPSLRKSMGYRRALWPECWIATSCHWVWAEASNLGVTAGRAGDLCCQLCCASSSSKMQDTKCPSCVKCSLNCLISACVSCW